MAVDPGKRSLWKPCELIYHPCLPGGYSPHRKTPVVFHSRADIPCLICIGVRFSFRWFGMGQNFDSRWGNWVSFELVSPV
jgi:hypothetical protein